MKCKWIILLLILTCSAGMNGVAQLSNKGTEFWVGYGPHEYMEHSVDMDGNPLPGGPLNAQSMVLYLSSEEETDVTVSIDSSGLNHPFGQNYSKTYHVFPNQVVMTDLMPQSGSYWDARLHSDPVSPACPDCTNSEGLFTRKGIHVVSKKPIVAYAHIYANVTSGASMLMPVETWGYKYTSLNSKQVRYLSNEACYSWMFVVAQHDNTVIEITPSVPTRNGRPAGVPFTVALNKGHIYQIIGAPDNVRSNDKTYGFELSGTTVTSIAGSTGKCYPIAVFSGSSRTENPCGGLNGTNILGADNDIQQVFPLQAWGKRYLTAPTSQSQSSNLFMNNIYKILVQDPNTVVKKNGVVLPQSSLVMPGSFYYYESDKPDYIESDKPVMVGQFISGGCLGTDIDKQGDPEMMYISPMEQGIKHIGFFRNNLSTIRFVYLTLIIPDSGVNSLKIDGKLDDWDYKYKHPNITGYTIVVKRWKAEQAQVIVSSDSAYTALTYGLGDAESYGYNAGTMINNLNATGLIHNQADTSRTVNEYTCAGTPVQLSVRVPESPSSRIEWLLSQVPGITPATDIVDVSPIPALTEVVRGVTYYTYLMNTTCTFATTGTFNVPVLNTNPNSENCIKTDSINITVIVKEAPHLSLTVTHTGCSSDKVHLLTSVDAKNSYTFNRFNWTFPDNGILKDSIKIDTLFKVEGDNAMHLQGITKEGCTADSSFIIKITKPKGGVKVSASEECLGKSLTFTPEDTFGGVQSWYWNFGDGDTRLLTNSNAIVKTFTTYGKYDVKLVAKTSSTCESDTIIATVTIYDIPKVTVNYPQGCLPEDGNVFFATTNTVRDNQVMASYAWNFDDAASTPANPNTSVLSDPSHIYSTVGKHNIAYSVKTEKGCSKDTLIEASFNVRPKFSKSLLAALCKNAAVTSVKFASVINGVPGEGIYKGPGITSAKDGTFNPSLAAAGTNTIWYVYTATSGCTDSVFQTIEVNPVPPASFTFTNNICEGLGILLTPVNSAIIKNWNWNFSNGVTASKTDGVPFEVTYSKAGDSTVTLTTVSDNGCVSIAFPQVISVHPKPLADFTPPKAICLPGGEAVFVNNSKGASTYQWLFGDGTGSSSLKNPSYTYTVAGSYAVRLKVTSEFGCEHDTTISTDKFFNKPLVSFTVSPKEFCQGSDATFTGASTGSAISTWRWDFGDGTTAATQTYIKNYKIYGQQPVHLTATTTEGCSADATPQTVTVYPQPVIEAGKSFVVPEGTTVQFQATSNLSSYQFEWTLGTGLPASALSDASVLTPFLRVFGNDTYKLTATGEFSCTATDSITVKLLREVKVPNAFSPNGDGINDFWQLPNLSDYPGCTVEVFNRYGQQVFYSLGYAVPWNGTQGGKNLPVGVYYYIIKLKNGFETLTGSVTILR